MSAIVFDTETTSANDPHLIEAAWLVMSDVPADNATQGAFHQRYKPPVAIELGALATHHIMDEDLVDMPPSDTFALPDGLQYMIGHNVDFDWKVVGSPDVKRICTLAMARAAWPDLDAHTQSALLYYLHRSGAREILRAAHSADADVRICHFILRHAIAALGGAADWEGVWAISEEARLPLVITFGKHKGTAIKDLPADYVRWYRRQDETDEYLLKAFARAGF